MSYLFKYFNHYLLITLTVSFILGLTLSFHFPHTSLPLSAFVISCSLVLVFLVLKGFNDYAAIVLVICFIFTGYLYGLSNSSRYPKSGDISHHFDAPEEAIIIGTLAQMASQRARGQTVTIDTAYLRLEEQSQMVPVSGKVLLKIDDNWPESIIPGDSCIVRGLFRKPVPARSPGFDYAGYLAEKEIYLTGTIQSSLLINELNLYTRGERLSMIFYFVERTRNTISQYLSSTLSEEHAALYQALLLGDKSRISPDLLDGFKRSGVMHILAISGMHMALLGFMLFSFFYFAARFSSRLILIVNVKKMSLLLCIIPLLLYALLAGSNTPVLRSFIMSLMFILAFCFNRIKSHMTILSSAALILLVANPHALTTASFQLSFAAVSSIVLITPKLLLYLPTHRRTSFPKGLAAKLASRCVEVLAVTISATVGTIPLLIYHFNQLSTVTLVANLLVEPLVCLWALPCGFLGVLFSFISPSLAALLFHIGTVSLDIVTDFTLYLSSLPLSTIWLPDTAVFLIAIYYGSLLLFVKGISPLSRILSLSLLAATLALFIAPITGITQSFSRSNSISFIDVGQGSSTLVQLPGGKTIVIDAGATSTPGFDCGERIIAPYLWSRGIGRIDDIVLTHGDADHYNGVSALLERFRPTRLWLPDYHSEKTGYNALISEARQRGVQIYYPRQGTFISTEKATLSLIGDNISHKNGVNHTDHLMNNDNNNSLVFSLNTQDFTVLLPGDISSVREQALIQTEIELKHDILLSPHHGSSTSNSPGFLNSVKPRYLVVSAGRRDNTLFPSVRTKESAASLGIEVLTTGRDGTIMVLGKNGDFEITTTVHETEKIGP